MPITVTNLTCVYGAGTPFETAALRDVSVTVENGSFVGILGRTGCGKSTLIQIMAGLLTPTAGTVILDGQDIHLGYITKDDAELSAMGESFLGRLKKNLERYVASL